MSTADDRVLDYHLYSVAARVTDEFSGVFSTETIARFLDESRDQFIDARSRTSCP